MKHLVLLQAQDHLADFLFHTFPALDDEDQIQLYRGVSGILRWAIREVQREEKQKWLEWVAERSQN